MPDSTSGASADVIIIGGGAVGCATAWSLAREGVRVTLLEQHGLAHQASGAVSGMLAPISEASEPGPFLRFGLESLRIYPDLCRELAECSGVDPEFIPSGILRVARDEAGVRALQQKAAALKRGTDELTLEWLGTSELRDLEPGLDDSLLGGLWSPAESQIRSPLLTRAYAGAAAALGARIEVGVPALELLFEGTRVVGVRTPGGPLAAGHVIVCAGCLSGEWLERAGATQSSMTPERGQLVVLEPRTPALRRIVWEGHTYLVPKRDGSVVVGATSERVGFDRRVTVEGVEGLLGRARRVLPGLGDADFRSAWAGLRPASADGLANIGPVPGVESLFVASGHHRNGVLLSAITGRLVASAVLGKSLPDDAAAFDPARWSRT